MPADDNHTANAVVRGPAVSKGKKDTEIRVSGIRLDRESLFEVEDKKEESCTC